MLNHNTKLFTQRAAPLMASATLGRQRTRVQPRLAGCAWLSASLLGSNVPALLETLRREVARAGGQRSRLQVVRIACLAARVGRDAAGVHASFHNSAIAESSATTRALAAERERAVLAGGTTSHNLGVAQLF